MGNRPIIDQHSDALICVVASQLNKIMEKRNVDTRDITNATGISTTLVNMLKRGEGNPSLSNLWKIARFFGVPISYFLETSSFDSKDEIVKQIRVFDLDCKKFIIGNEQYILPVKTEQYPNADFAVRINNKSMEPIFNDGTVFIVSQNSKPKNGNTILIKTTKSNFVRKINIFSNKTFISTLDIKSEIEKLNSYEILGIVIGIMSNKE